MSVPKKRWLAVGLLLVLALVVAASVAALKLERVPILVALVLLPGQVVDFAVHGGNVHAAERDSTVLLNIAVWSLLLGGTAIALFRSSLTGSET